MAIRIQIESTEVETKSGISARNSKPYSIREQVAWAYFFDRSGRPNPHPTKVRLTLDDKTGQGPYPVGMYELADSSFFADRFGGIEVGPILKPAELSQVKPAKAA